MRQQGGNLDTFVAALLSNVAILPGRKECRPVCLQLWDPPIFVWCSLVTDTRLGFGSQLRARLILSFQELVNINDSVISLIGLIGT